MDGLIAYALSRKYTKKSMEGGGAIAGKPCQISSITDITGGHRVTFKWYLNDGTEQTGYMDVADGVDGDSISFSITTITGGHRVTITSTDGTSNSFDIFDGQNGDDGISVTNAEINASNHLILTLSDGNTIDCGEVKGAGELNELSDVNLDTLTDGDVLTYDATSGKWINKELDIAVDLKDLDDVNITSGTLTDGSIIKWDAANNKWVNGTIPNIESLNDIDDVSVASATNGQTLKFNGTNWVNADNKVVDLKDINITDPQNGQILIYDSVSNTWKNGSPSATSTSLDDLSNVSIDNIQNNQILKYDAENQVWVNANGGAVSVDHLGDIGDVNLTNVQNGQVIVWNNTLQKWVNAEVATKLSELTDVQLTALTNQNLLRYNSTTQKWENFASDSVVTENSTNTVTSGAVYTAVNDAKNGCVEQVATLGTASDKPSKVVQYIGTPSGDIKRGYFYFSEPSVVSGEVVYNWVRVDVQPSNSDYDALTNKPTINDIIVEGDLTLDALDIQKKFQYNILPSPSNSLVGVILEYTGATTSDYKTGRFYQCQYISSEATYKWTEVDIAGVAELDARLTTVETNIGDMSDLQITGVSDIIGALNKLAIRGIKSITYTEPNLIITLQDDTTFTFDITVILQQTDIGELANVLDSTIQNGNLLQYDASISKYKPYDVVTVLTGLLQNAKDYTDQEIASSILDDALYVDQKPVCSYDSGTSQYIVVYYQGGQVHTTTNTAARFYYKDANDDPYCTSWFIVDEGGSIPTAVEFTYLLSSVNLDDFVNKNTDVVSTYTTSMLDKSKIPNIAALDALYTLVVTALALKVNTADIVDNLASDDATVPLSAKQGKALKTLVDTKQNIMQYTTMPVVNADRVANNEVAQFIGATAGAYVKGHFYEAVYVVADDVYKWQEISPINAFDATIIENSTNAPQGGAVYTALNDKQDKNLSTPITIGGASQTTVEDALGALNTAKQDVVQVSTMPVASSSLEAQIYQFIGTTTQDYTNGYFYRCDEVSTGVYGWTEIEFGSIGDFLEETTELPIASASNVNKTYLLTANQVGFLRGGIYQNQSDGEPTPTYSWVLISSSNLTAGDGIEITNDQINVVDRLEETTTLPTASIDNLGKCYLYLGNASGYQNGGIYQCQSDGEPTPTYSWVLISANPLEAGGGITLENDVISADTNIFHGTRAQYEALSADDKKKYSHIGSPETVSGDFDIYSTTETKTNKVWIDGKPIYRKVINLSSDLHLDINTWTEITQMPKATIERVISLTGWSSSELGYYVFSIGAKIGTTYIEAVSYVGIMVKTFAIEYTKTTD